MIILYPKRKVEGFEHKIFSLEEVYWKLDEAAVLDRNFRKAVTDSFDSEGIIWPPIVWTQETYMAFLEEGNKKHDTYKDLKITQTYRVSLGNNRFEYAKDKGFTHIECVFAKHWTDRDLISAQTLMRYGKDY
jgi:hypothetical protein